MHREEAVEDLRRDEVIVRTEKLDAHDGGFDPTDYEKQQSVGYIKDAQPLVIDSCNPFVERVDKRSRGKFRGGPNGRVSRHRALSSTYSTKRLQIGCYSLQILFI